jgi:hypothetical protein
MLKISRLVLVVPQNTVSLASTGKTTRVLYHLPLSKARRRISSHVFNLVANIEITHGEKRLGKHS